MGLLGVEVLLLEDNEADAVYVADILNRQQPPGVTLKYWVRQAQTLQEAEVYLKAPGLDVVLLDLNLPDSQGLATFEAVRRHKTAPVIILTGASDVGIALEAVTAGAGYLIKDWVVASPALLHFSILAAVETARQAEAIRGLQREQLGDSRRLISACAGCGKWRDKSDNRWLTPEEYMEMYAGINLSHGVCPECLQAKYASVLEGSQP